MKINNKHPVNKNFKINQDLQNIINYKAKYGYPVDLLRYNLLPINQKDLTQHYKIIYNRYLYSSKDLIDASKLQNRIKMSLQKIKLAQKLTKPLKKIPFIQAIFITGDIASLNAVPTSDIDIWLIVDSNRIWTTRFLEWIILTILGRRRNFLTRSYKDKLCINFYKTVDDFRLSKQDIYFAGQFIDAICIYCKDLDIYYQLVKQNSWISNYFRQWYKKTLFILEQVNKLHANKKAQPHTSPTPKTKNYHLKYQQIHFKLRKVFNNFLDFIEMILGTVQILKGERHLTFNTKITELTTWYDNVRYKKR